MSVSAVTAATADPFSAAPDAGASFEAVLAQAETASALNDFVGLGGPAPGQIRVNAGGNIASDGVIAGASPEAASIRQRILDADGLTLDVAREIRDNSNVDWDDVLEPGLYMVTAAINVGPAQIADHRHFVYVPDNGAPAQIINAGPVDSDSTGADRTRLDVQVLTLDDFFGSYAIGGTWRLFKADTGSNVDLDARWDAMKAAGRAIDGAELNYHYSDQNSNSVAGTVAEAGGVDVGLVGEIAPGWNNDLRDEVNGGQQSPSEGRPGSPSS